MWGTEGQSLCGVDAQFLASREGNPRRWHRTEGCVLRACVYVEDRGADVQPHLSWAGPRSWSSSVSPGLPGSGRGYGGKAWVEGGGGDPGEDAAGVQQRHGGGQEGSGQRQDRAEGKGPQTPRRGLLNRAGTASSLVKLERQRARPGPRPGAPWRPGGSGAALADVRENDDDTVYLRPFWDLLRRVQAMLLSVIRAGQQRQLLV